MQRSTFGRPGEAPVSTPRLTLGCSQVGSFGNRHPDQAVRAVLARALDLGANAYDTADIYGQGDSEREIGRLLRGRRGAAFVVTKLGKRFSPKMRALAPLKPIVKPLLRLRPAKSGGDGVSARRGGEMREDFSPGRFAGALDASLHRLGFDHVDGLLLHSPPAEVCRDPAVWAALQALKDTGKTRMYGVSCDDIEAMRAAAAMPGLGLIQVPLDVFDQAAGEGLTARLASAGVGLFVREVIRGKPGLSPEAALRAALDRPGVTSAVVGTSRLEHLEHLCAAVA